MSHLSPVGRAGQQGVGAGSLCQRVLSACCSPVTAGLPALSFLHEPCFHSGPPYSRSFHGSHCSRAQFIGSGVQSRLQPAPGQAHGHRAELGADDRLAPSWQKQRLSMAGRGSEQEAPTSCHKVSKGLQRGHAEAGLGMSGSLPRAPGEGQNPTWPIPTSRALLLLGHLPKGPPFSPLVSPLQVLLRLLLQAAFHDLSVSPMTWASLLPPLAQSRCFGRSVGRQSDQGQQGVKEGTFPWEESPSFPAILQLGLGNVKAEHSHGRRQGN